MPVGDITPSSDGRAIAVLLLDTTTAANGQPSGAVGLAMSAFTDVFGPFGMPTDLTLELASTAGSGVMTVTGRLWGRSIAGIWSPLGIGADSTKGVIDAGSTIGETVTDAIRHAETVSLPGHFERLYFEVVNIGGTSTAVQARLTARMGYPR
jgi:hypothetical protein